MHKFYFISILIAFVCIYLCDCTGSRFQTQDDINIWFDSLCFAKEDVNDFDLYNNTVEVDLYKFEDVKRHIDKNFASFELECINLDILLDKGTLEINSGFASHFFSKVSANSLDSLYNSWLTSQKELYRHIRGLKENDSISIIPEKIRIAVSSTVNSKPITILFKWLSEKKFNKVYFLAESAFNKYHPHIPDSNFYNEIIKKSENLKSVERVMLISDYIEKEFNKCPQAANVFALMANVKSEEKIDFLSENIPEALTGCQMKNHKKILTIIYALTYHRNNFITWKNIINENGEKIIVNENDQWKDIAPKLFKLRGESIWFDLKE